MIKAIKQGKNVSEINTCKKELHKMLNSLKNFNFVLTFGVEKNLKSFNFFKNKQNKF